jgi:hypothetical protein
MNIKNEKKEQTQGKFTVQMPLRVVLIGVLFALVAPMGIAGEQRGTIIRTEVDYISGGRERLFILVDTDGNRIPDISLMFPDPMLSTLSRDLQSFVERGMIIIFDDEGMIIYDNGNKQVSGDNTISIDGVNMLDLFPNERERFKFASEAKRRERVQSTPSGGEE